MQGHSEISKQWHGPLGFVLWQTVTLPAHMLFFFFLTPLHYVNTEQMSIQQTVLGVTRAFSDRSFHFQLWLQTQTWTQWLSCIFLFVCNEYELNRTAWSGLWSVVTKCAARVIAVHLHTRERHKVNSSNYSVGRVLVFSGLFHHLSLATAIKEGNNDTMIASASSTWPKALLCILRYSLDVALPGLTLLLCSGGEISLSLNEQMVIMARWNLIISLLPTPDAFLNIRDDVNVILMQLWNSKLKMCSVKKWRALLPFGI